MTTFALISTIILVFLGVTLVVTLVLMAVLALDIVRAVRRIRVRVQPLSGKIRQLADTSKELSGIARRTAREINEETSRVAEEVSRRARRTAWLYRHIIFSPIASMMREG